jgi:hypothetical protein
MQSNVRCREHEPLSEGVIVDVPRRLDRAVDEAVGTVVGDSPRRARSGRDLDSGRRLTHLPIIRTHQDDSCSAGPSNNLFCRSLKITLVARMSVGVQKAVRQS